MRDLAKRKRIMQRSMKLGHCICNPKLKCPCEMLLEQDICHCAGERPEQPAGPVRLTRLVPNPGCASKIDQVLLSRVLSGLPEIDHPQVVVGMAAADDAGVFQVDDSIALVQTVDVFCPSLDDPYMFGQVAAANSLSDVYAMGGQPITALSVIGFPADTAPDEAMTEILRGGIDKMNEAGVPVIGGHSIRDPEVKAGFAVTGLIDSKKMITNAGAQPGDVLILTKPLGTGIIAFAAQIGRAPASVLEATARSMTTLNKTAAELMVDFGAHACTDVTGFGLMGHLSEMGRLSGVDLEILWDDLPLFPGVIECVAEEILPGGIERNREASGDHVTMGQGTQQGMLDVCLDPQTSGGLLIVLPEKKAGAFLQELHDRGVTDAAVIGAVRGEGSGRVFLQTRGSRPIPVGQTSAAQAGVRAVPVATGTNEAEDADGPCCAEAVSAVEGQSQLPVADCCTESEVDSLECCADGGDAGSGGRSGPGAPKRMFAEFLKSATVTPAALDAATKEAVSLALSIGTRCGPCTEAHLKRAREMGFSQEEIEELAMMAVAFGGSPVMMFYNEARK